MPYLNSNHLHISQVAPAIAADYIVSARHEFTTGIDRYRFEVAVKGQSLQPLLIDGLAGLKGPSEVINTALLKMELLNHGLSEKVLLAMAHNSCDELHHLKGTDKHTACRLAYHLPALEPSRLHLVTPFFELNESLQCPRCRNQVDPNYLPVWRFRDPQLVNLMVKPKKVLPS